MLVFLYRFLYCYVSTLLLFFFFYFSFLPRLARLFRGQGSMVMIMYPKCLNKLEAELEHVLAKVITILVKNL